MAKAFPHLAPPHQQNFLWNLVRLNIHWPEGLESVALAKINRCAGDPQPPLTREDLRFQLERWTAARMYSTFTQGQQAESRERLPDSEDLPVVVFRGDGFERIAAGVHRIGKWFREAPDDERDIIVVTRVSGSARDTARGKPT